MENNGEGVPRIASIMVIVCTSYPGCPNTQEMAVKKNHRFLPGGWKFHEGCKAEIFQKFSEALLVAS